MRNLRFVFAIALSISGGALFAQQSGPNAVTTALEMPAHRALRSVTSREDAALAPFTTDGCSGGLSEVWGLVADTFPDFADRYSTEPPWEACCVAHDMVYHDAGGAETATESFDARLIADRALQACVVKTGETELSAMVAEFEVTPQTVQTAYDTIAGAMYLAVRFGGAPCSGLPWRWGYGYVQCSVMTGAFE